MGQPPPPSGQAMPRQGVIHWIWSMVVRPVATLQMALTGKVPVPALVTLAVVVNSLYSATILGIQENNLRLGLYAAMATVMAALVGIYVQIFLIWASARLLGWPEGTMAQLFPGFGSVFALNVVLDMVRWGPQMAGYQVATVAVEVTGVLWLWILMVAAIRLTTGLTTFRAVLAILPAALLSDVLLLVLSFRATGTP